MGAVYGRARPETNQVRRSSNEGSNASEERTFASVMPADAGDNRQVGQIRGERSSQPLETPPLFSSLQPRGRCD